jgi:lipopolysaccharide export system protein LptA
VKIPLLALATILAASSFAQISRAAEPPATQTVIDSDSLEMTAGDDVNNFRFSGNVHAISQGMALSCDRLDIIARRLVKSKATIGKMNSVQSVVAEGNVRIEQVGRVATSGRAEVLPDKGLVILSDNPKIVDTKATVEGWKIIYNSRDRTAQVLPSPDEQVVAGQEKIRSRVIIAEEAVPKIEYEDVLGAEKPTLDPKSTPTDSKPKSPTNPK